MQEFTYDPLPGRVVFGAGRLRHVAGEVDRLGARRVVVFVSDREAQRAGSVLAALGDRVVSVWSQVRPHVPVELAEQARAHCTRQAADLLLCLGGGSTIGLAKAVALTGGRPILAVPTTYSGSEMTPVWGMTEAGRKTTGRSAAVLPRVVVYDPELTLTLPAQLTGTSGLNAMAHCVEALYAPGANPVLDLLALAAIRALATGLPAAARRPDDIAARAELLHGAFLAGTVMAGAGTSIHHKVCHVLGGRYDLPHAALHATVLPHSAAFVAPAAPEQLARVAAALGVDDAPAGLFDLAAGFGAADGLRGLGVSLEQVDAVVPAILAAGAAAGSPRPVDEPGVRRMLHDAWSGRRPGGAR